MPDTTQSAELITQRTTFPPNTREVLTLQVRQRPMDLEDYIHVVFVVDIGSSMAAEHTVLANSFAALDAALTDDYPHRRYTVVEYRGDGLVNFLTGVDPVNYATALTALASLLASGASGAPYAHSALRAAARLTEWWDDALRAVVLWTDAEPTTGSVTFAMAKRALLRHGCVFYYGTAFTNSQLDNLVDITRGKKLLSTVSADLAAELAAELNDFANSDTASSLWLVNDNVNFTATLETGQEVTFQRRPFALDPFHSGEDGAVSIPLTVDNMDLAVTRFLAGVKDNNQPVEVFLRVYDANDPSGPQNNPPLRLFANGFEARGGSVSCSLTWLDIQNSLFPNTFYTPERCPSLQS